MGDYYDMSEYEPLARFIWREHNIEPPLDVRGLCGELDITLERSYDLPADVDGLYMVSQAGCPRIVINAIKPVMRQRFSAAHELAHHILTPSPSPGVECRLPALPHSKTKEDVKCDQLAACLLMPAHLVSDEFKRVKDNPTCRVAILANRFQVSRAAMYRRLCEIGLITQYRLNRYGL